MDVGNENVVADAATVAVESGVPLPSWSSSVSPAPLSPDTVPSTGYVLVVHATSTLVTLARLTEPLPAVTVHVWLGRVGWVPTVTA